MSTYSQKTVFLDLIESARTKGVPWEPPRTDLTLNDYFDVQSGNLPNESAGGDPIYPSIQYLAIGRGGHRNATGAGGASLTDVLQHNVDHARLFEHIPFVMRQVDDDLTTSERANYRLRTLESIDGIDYWCYYLRKISFSSSDVTTQMVTTTNGVTTEEDYEFSPSLMTNPQPLPMENGQVVESSGRKLSLQNDIYVGLNGDDVNNIVDACEKKYGDPRYAIISEFAFVAGYEQEVTDSRGGQTVTYTEGVSTQCTHFVGEVIYLSRDMPGVDLNYKIGNIYPYTI